MAVQNPTAALCLLVLLASTSPIRAHVIVFKTCLDETLEAASTPLIGFTRRTLARHSGVYSWNALAADKFGGEYADFTMSKKTRAVCTRADAGGFECVLTGMPCREVDDCANVVNRACYEMER